MTDFSPTKRVLWKLQEDKDRFESRNFKLSGIDVIDSMVLAKQLFRVRLDKPETMTLDEVSKFLFKDDDAKVTISSPSELWSTKQFDKLLEYNKQDVYLTVKITNEMKSLQYLYGLRLFIPKVNVGECQYNSILIDNLILTKFKHLVFPSRPFVDKLELEGGKVSFLVLH